MDLHKLEIRAFRFVTTFAVVDREVAWPNAAHDDAANADANNGARR